MYIVKPFQTLCQRSFTQVYNYQQFRKVPFSTPPLLGNLSGKKCYLTLLSISLITNKLNIPTPPPPPRMPACISFVHDLYLPFG